MLGKNISESGTYWASQGYGTTSWPAVGEIDILEHWGNNQNYAHSAMHTTSSHGATVNNGGQYISGISSQFHTYSMDWDANKNNIQVNRLNIIAITQVLKMLILGPMTKNSSFTKCCNRAQYCQWLYRKCK